MRDRGFVERVDPFVVGVEMAVGRTEKQATDTMVPGRGLEFIEPPCVQLVAAIQGLRSEDTHESVGIRVLEIDDQLVGA